MQSFQNITIVVVEDHSEIRFLIGAFLKRLGAKVFTAADAYEGLWTIRTKRPDVVLLDIRLPDRDGFQLLKDIRALEGKVGRVPVIAMTAYFHSFSSHRTIEAGFREHLTKPFSPSELLKVISSVLNPL
jgi:DNA-binding response OmpR family regulator